MIRAEQLRIACGDFRLGPVDLSIPAGSYLTLLGPSGAGKTILLEALMGLLKPAAGRVLLNGEEMAAQPPERRNIAYLPQDLALFPHLSVQDNILFGSRVRRLDPAASRDRLAELVAMLDLEGPLTRRDISTLSGGEKQRVALARALLPNPQLLFLDEPHSALDAGITRQLQIKLRQINRELGVTILHVTHDQEEAFMLGGQIAVLIDGRLQQLGSSDEIYYGPANLSVARFLRHQNIFSLTVAERLPDGRMRLRGELDLVCASGRDLPVGTRVAVGIRNEEVTLIRPDRPVGDDLRDNLFAAVIVDIFGFGGYHTLVVKIRESPATIELNLPNCAFRDLGLGTGDKVRISLRARSLWVLPPDDGEPRGQHSYMEG
ncbi:molybdenum ABC transporter ATP-binding protein [Geothermobacter hydrogeniphilus]|uniref:Molybdenum ABC transporter ATP-binding protein n=1 Tax=Geothermobacter hydrogeniphilus TaxID=1969733 RepID=A0A2K2HCE6_9BACT|nr:ABC transporter ATP-binding protein [Geothermobacter hydrogeniphilus]PNU20982.1 molybdenum ABC transporter ATP-binding protein [Geothermobacter hydrogeniphilus]